MKKYSGNHSVNSKKKHGVIRHSGLVMCSILFILCSCMYFGNVPSFGKGNRSTENLRCY